MLCPTASGCFPGSYDYTSSGPVTTALMSQTFGSHHSEQLKMPGSYRTTLQRHQLNSFKHLTEACRNTCQNFQLWFGLSLTSPTEFLIPGVLGCIQSSKDLIHLHTFQRCLTFHMSRTDNEKPDLPTTCTYSMTGFVIKSRKVDKVNTFEGMLLQWPCQVTEPYPTPHL